MGDPASADHENKAQARPVEAVPTFAGTIESILQAKCQRCHSVGGIAPFPLATYEDIANIAPLAKQKVVSREMPPWGAFDDEACKVQHKWRDDLRLTEDELAKLVGWMDSGMPRGDEALRPPPQGPHDSYNVSLATSKSAVLSRPLGGASLSGCRRFATSAAPSLPCLRCRS